jgi:hypothetical protein
VKVNEKGLSHHWLLAPFRRNPAEAIRLRHPDKPEGDTMDTRWHTPEPVGNRTLALFRNILTAGGRTGEPKTDIVVAVGWCVPVAVGGAHVLRFVVPRAAAQHPAQLGINLG